MILSSLRNVVLAVLFASLSFLLVSMLSQHATMLSFALIAGIAAAIGYFIACNIYPPLQVFIGSSVFLSLIGSKLMIGSIEDYYGGVGAGKLYIGLPHISIVLGVIAIGFHAARSVDQRKAEAVWNKNKMMAIFLCIVIVSAIQSPYSLSSMPQLNFYISIIALYGMWIYAIRRIERAVVYSLFTKVYFALVILELAICLLQLMKGSALGLGFIGEGTIGEDRAGLEVSMVTGTFRHPGPLSLFFAIGMAVLFPSFIQKQWKVTGTGFIFAAVGLILTFSRTSMIMVIPVILIEWLLLSRGGIRVSKVKIVSIAFIGMIIMYIFGGLIGARFFSLESNASDSQVDNRVEHFQMAWAYIKEHPIAGYGLNSWSYVTHHLQLPTVVGNKPFFYDNPVHNIYLYLWFEGGLLMLSAFLMLIFLAMRSLYANVKKGMYLEGGLFASLLCVLVYGMTGWGLFNGGQLLYIFFFILALANGLRYSIENKNESNGVV